MTTSSTCDQHSFLLTISICNEGDGSRDQRSWLYHDPRGWRGNGRISPLKKRIMQGKLFQNVPARSKLAKLAKNFGRKIHVLNIFIFSTFRMVCCINGRSSSHTIASSNNTMAIQILRKLNWQLKPFESFGIKLEDSTFISTLGPVDRLLWDHCEILAWSVP